MNKNIGNWDLTTHKRINTKLLGRLVDIGSKGKLGRLVDIGNKGGESAREE